MIIVRNVFESTPVERIDDSALPCITLTVTNTIIITTNSNFAFNMLRSVN